MQVEILTIGDELCRGEIVDTNAAWLAQALWERDITVIWKTTCRDVEADIVSAVRRAAERAEVVLTSGGLGPTSDDLTVDVMSSLLGVDPEEHAPSRAQMEARLKIVGIPPTSNHNRQVRAPAGATVFQNPAGLAPGFEIVLTQGAKKTSVFCLPGPPKEVKALFKQAVEPRLIELRERGGAPMRIAKRIYRAFGRGESQIAEMLGDAVPTDDSVSLHYQAQFPEILVKVVVRDKNQTAADSTLARLDQNVRQKLSRHIYGIDSDSLSAVVGRALSAKKQTLATAESCTGGMIGSLLTDTPGSSDYYLGGVVGYHDKVKQELLGVRPETIAKEGAVSEAVVKEMAQGVARRLSATFGLAVSGVAGPDGGTPEKPVGTVWFAIADNNRVLHTKRICWPGNRHEVRVLAAYWGLRLVLRASNQESDD